VYEWVEHTGELELQIDAPSDTAVLEEATAAIGELIGGERHGGEHRDITVEANDHATLLAELLQELVYFAETEDFIPSRLARVELRDGSLRAIVEGHTGSPRHLVKAVTYHRLAFDRHEAGWRARVILDV
jgi:SHS2 domain-containing protein